jgi:hypothetical protein
MQLSLFLGVFGFFNRDLPSRIYYQRSNPLDACPESDLESRDPVHLNFGYLRIFSAPCPA